uniref:Reverse transcriptase domain-containing protein n=1 Tax=Pseudobryopsis hainanensis TaxID=2320808 RepID=A0A3S7SZW6_9CHLO|nr:hypothetical protein [Pseudobryopsis hainanensis]
MKIKELLYRMINTGNTRLKAIQKRNTEDNNYANTRLYPLLYQEDLWVSAYEKLKSNKGALTPGQGRKTIDGFGSQDIDRLIQKFRDQSWRPKPAMIPKLGKTTKRPLGVQGPVEKLVQEIVRQILEAIYEPSFIDQSHGFRPNRGCHTALAQVEKKFQAMRWVVEGGITGCYDNIPHHKLIAILRKRIRDERFLNLIQKLLRAGYFLEGTTDLKRPQGSIVSPLLANIYLNEMDQWVEQRKKNWVTEGKNIRTQEAKRVEYVRYADDWILGISGTKSLAYTIKDAIGEFLKTELQLELSEPKTYITDISTKPVRFLEYDIRVKPSKKIKQIKSKAGSKFTKQTTGFRVQMMAPMVYLVNRLSQRGFCDKNGFPVAQLKFTAQDDFEIVEAYKWILIGINNYYSGATYQQPLSRIDYILRWSCAKTLAHKHKSTCSKIFKKHGKNLKVSKLIETQKGGHNSVWVDLPRRKYKNKLAKWQTSSVGKDPFDILPRTQN